MLRKQDGSRPNVLIPFEDISEFLLEGELSARLSKVQESVLQVGQDLLDSFHQCTQGRGSKYQGWYINHKGKRTFFTGTHKKAETRRIADKLESEEDQIKLGYRQAPENSIKAGSRLFQEVVEEYMSWGNCQGGRAGGPWGKTHAKERRNKLAWWGTRLELSEMRDLNGSLPIVEKALRELQNGGIRGNGRQLSGKTLKHYAETITSFCNWALTRGYLESNPLRGLCTFNSSPTSLRRALRKHEIQLLLKAAPAHRAILYETALLTGLRAGELRSLTPENVNADEGVLHLDSAWTKNRKSGNQPIPKELAERLVKYGAEGFAKQLYENQYHRRDARVDDIPKNPLFFVSTHPSRELDIDLKKAGIPRDVPGEGKVVFHSLRVTFITNVIETGANVKEAQELARHSSPNLTMNVYAKTKKESLFAVIDKVAGILAHE